ncbi:MAG TPA: hypothetical protein VGA87_09090 [Pyrinomonadaceae bacterium]
MDEFEYQAADARGRVHTAAREIIREPAPEVRSLFLLPPEGLFAFAFPRPTV